MESQTPCPICRTPRAGRASSGASTIEIHCSRCGRFLVQTLAETKLMNSPPAFPPPHLLSGLCRNTWDALGEKLLVTVDLFASWAELEKAAKIVVPRDTDLTIKGDYILRFLRRRSKSLADTVAFTPAELAVGFCANKSELLFSLQFLRDKGFVEEGSDAAGARKGAGGGLVYRLTPAGWAALDDAAATASGRVGFVSLSADKEDDPLWQGFSEGVRSAGYQAARLETREHANKITDELKVDVRRAAFVVADLSGQSPLAYFVAGLAEGLGKPVFWTCEEGVARDKKLWLEARQTVVTLWTRDKLDDFSRRLAQRIEATLGRP